MLATLIGRAYADLCAWQTSQANQPEAYHKHFVRSQAEVLNGFSMPSLLERPEWCAAVVRAAVECAL